MERPADRQSFYEAQHRHRRAARWQTWLVAVALAVQSLPLGVVLFAMVTNLLYVVVLVTAMSSEAASSGPPAILSLIDPFRTPLVLAPPFTAVMVALVWGVWGTGGTCER